jgi:uncharacterized repeat protein (TIGR03803 family)
MFIRQQARNLLCRTTSGMATAASVMAILFVLTFVVNDSVQAQTFNVIHSFTGQTDGANPLAGLTMDATGTLYGTTLVGGPYLNSGTVFKLAHRPSGWVLTPLHYFNRNEDGASPKAGVIFGPDGTLYGTTYDPGSVFNLKPPANVQTSALSFWTESLFYLQEGTNPRSGLVFDQAGNLYGTTAYGSRCDGTVYELTPSAGGWTESVVHCFSALNDGYRPWSGVVFDQSGNLYGTTYWGGPYSVGTVFELSPSASGWTETVLHNFEGGNDGENPIGGLIVSASGNVYGTTPTGGTYGGGTVFELRSLNGTWVYTVLYNFSGAKGPEASLSIDADGNLYGTSYNGGTYGWGSVFKLTPSGGGWIYTSLHDFTAGNDGSRPVSDVIFDVQGNLYGTAELNGAYGRGIVWEITP